MSAAERQSPVPRPLYDPRRAIEHMQTLDGIMPIRLFAILFPLWEVETTATQEGGRPYELLEKYVGRGIDEADLHTVKELEDFFRLKPEMVQKILQFLSMIGHVTCNGIYWDLTPLGRKSVREGKKFVQQEKQVRFYFDGYTSSPLRKEHYQSKKVVILSQDEASEVLTLKTWGYRFHFLSSQGIWTPQALQELEARVDRNEYNMPPEMRKAQVHTVRIAYIPMYLIETRRQITTYSAQGVPQQKPYYLVYTGIRDLRDTYLEALLNRNQTVYAALHSEKGVAQRALWERWLDDTDVPGSSLLERPDGTWQAIFPHTAFEGSQAKYALTRIGDYELRQGYFLQIWCKIEVLRRKAALDRLLRLIKRQQHYIKRQTVEEQLLLQSKLLQLEKTLEFGDLHQRANETGMREMANVLDALEQAKKNGKTKPSSPPEGL